MEQTLHHRDYVAVNEMGEPVSPLDIIMHYTSIIEEHNWECKKHGYQYIRMTDLPKKLQDKYVAEINGYPFVEGDTYYTIENGQVVECVWDDLSKKTHKDNPDTDYYKSHVNAVDELKTRQLESLSNNLKADQIESGYLGAYNDLVVKLSRSDEGKWKVDLHEDADEHGDSDVCIACWVYENRHDAFIEYQIRVHQYTHGYPYGEGDTYYTIDPRGQVVESIWDDVSEGIHDADPNRKYYTFRHQARRARDKNK